MIRAVLCLTLVSCSLSTRLATHKPPRTAWPAFVDTALALAAFGAAIHFGGDAIHRWATHETSAPRGEVASLLGFTGLAVGIATTSIAVNYDPPACAPPHRWRRDGTCQLAVPSPTSPPW